MENEVTQGFFLPRVKAYLKQLLTKPSTAVLDDELKHELAIRNISQEEFLKLLLKEGIVVRKESVDDELCPDHQKVTFDVDYKVPRDRFERKVEKLYLRIFGDQGELDEATAAAGASGPFSQPLFPVQRKKIYVTKEQYDRLFEAVEVSNRMGEFGYDAPGLVVDKDDPTLVHNKKGGIACDRLKESATDKFMEEHGIEKEIQPGVGFSEKEQKWYGWSHRAFCGFGIGDKAKECYPSGTKEGNKCKTLDDCKKAAIAFANSVS